MPDHVVPHEERQGIVFRSWRRSRGDGDDFHLQHALDLSGVFSHHVEQILPFLLIEQDSAQQCNQVLAA